MSNREPSVVMAGYTPEAAVLGDSPPSLAAGSFPTGSLVGDVTYNDSPAALLRREIALWTSPQMSDVRAILPNAALIDAAVWITGETGTGKEVVARAIHFLGHRRHGPFVIVNCAASAREPLEGDLFGREADPSRAGHPAKIGKLEIANRGTILLDDFGELHPALQARLLRVLEEGEFSRVGGREMCKADVRLVVATARDLEASLANGRFRQDLYYRLNVIRIVVPPLRQRVEEIPLLVNYFVDRYSRVLKREGFTLPSRTIQRLKQHSFPGNVRELENVIKRMIVLREPELTPIPDLSAPVQPAARPPSRRTSMAAGSLRTISRAAAQVAEHSVILSALEETHWNRRRAAQLLNVSYRSLLRKIRKAGLDGKGKDVAL